MGIKLVKRLLGFRVYLVGDKVRVHLAPDGGLEVIYSPERDLELVLDGEGLGLGQLQLLLQVGLLVRQLELPRLHPGHLLPQVPGHCMGHCAFKLNGKMPPNKSSTNEDRAIVTSTAGTSS